MQKFEMMLYNESDYLARFKKRRRNPPTYTLTPGEVILVLLKMRRKGIRPVKKTDCTLEYAAEKHFGALQKITNVVCGYRKPKRPGEKKKRQSLGQRSKSSLKALPQPGEK